MSAFGEFEPSVEISAVRRVVDLSDEARVKAVCEVFERHGYPPDVTFARSQAKHGP